MKRSRRSKISRQFHGVYVVALLIPLTVIGLLLISYARGALYDYYEQFLKAENRRVKTFLTEVTMQAYEVSTQVVTDSVIKEALGREYADSSEFLAAVNHYNSLTLLNYNSLEIADICIYTDNPTIKNYRQFRCVTDEIAASDWYRKAQETSNPFWVSIEEQGYSSAKNNLSLVRRINPDGADYTVVAVVRLSDSYIRSRVDAGSIIEAVSVDDRGIVYSSQLDLYGREQAIAIDYDEDYFRSSDVVELDGKQYMATVSTINLYKTNSHLYVCTLDSSGMADIRRITTTWLLVLGVATLVPLAIVTVYAAYFSGRIKRLRAQMHKASHQDYDILTDFGGSDELTEVFEDLQIMVRDIKEKEARMYEAELNERELRNNQQLMEYKMLSSQINPHYLYNTLETIRMKSLTQGDREVADAIKLLGKTLHYVQENTGTAFTTVQKELDHVQNYLAIQRLRFGDRINYVLDVGEGVDTEKLTILPLLLQPVVENAVVHGLETVDGKGMVEIALSVDGDRLAIRVRDNGVGMTAEQLAAIREGIHAPRPPRSSIALYNIHRRIRLRYGERYGIEVDSAPGEGTCVRLYIPAQ